MSKFTPGPWTIRYSQIIGEGVGIAEVKNRNQEANARLIAASPDLLKACKRISSGETSFVYLLKTVELCQLAIAKAEGGEP